MSILLEISELADEMEVDFQIPEIYIEPGALKKIKSYILTNKWNKIFLVYDENTYQAVGQRLEELLKRDFLPIQGIKLISNENDQVIADEKSLVQFLIETPNDADVIIAVGSGTIHDIVRFAGHKMNIPFISVPTAASVDEFTLKGAPLILRGVKQTIQTAAPIAVFADMVKLHFYAEYELGNYF